MKSILVKWPGQPAPRTLHAVLCDRGQEFWDMALHWSGNRHKAEAIVADAFVHLWQKQPVLKTMLELRVFLYEAVCLSSIYFLQTHMSGAPYYELVREILHRYTNPGERTLMDELLLNSCLEELKHLSVPPMSKEVFTRYYVGGENLVTIANNLQIPAGEAQFLQLLALQQLVYSDRIYSLPQI
ncbi:RNA polymerase sigma factor [Deminuibacter soli]|uniref:Uncharacterized protein n=1 Tax=Deminuibacter soli TaxID=2291815 RepID=A0A3E1NQ94_9BACT|nr:sigma-70 family RNA polymerase sigma factor [Deminuibacter soli]RFM29968.1 hypothetical protein DXN05_03060 [Deminuibacter soli]